ncbi:ABC transporter ATP-binding protein [Parasynechococcus marenigrum]|uniref:Multidrug efflux ABC transporter n=1 Tax=Parasynechococcus marenigrum (strain WH8102) TaxID=84588 RepID=Q7U9T0_PARMW|nr:ABC transporter ATP-binding protein [Parasynechococcus marenigrum]QNJ12839.1 ABC transporter family protein [Synechococcus sp. A18-46.1]CAE06688.1 putative multidrug efflux ABC transporter [Parasynechococcus marenigrum WH 8102]
MHLRSQTWTDLRRLFKELPAKRVRFLVIVLVASFLQGLMDLALVGMMTRLAGLMAGGRLQDQLPGVRVFGGGILDQAGWLLFLLAATFWIASLSRFGVALLQSFLSAEIWNDLVNKVYSNLMMQRYEFFADNRSANLAESFNRVLNRVSNSVIVPLLAVAGNALSIIVLLVGVVFAIGWSAVWMFALMFAAYVVASAIVTPYIRRASKQRVRYSRRINMILMESLRSMRDVHLYSADRYFLGSFSRNGIVAKRYERLVKLLPDVPRFLIEPAAITILFAAGLAPVVLSGDVSDVRDSVPSIVAVLITLTRISAPLQSTFRNLNKLRGGLPDIKDSLELLSLKPKRLLLDTDSVPTPSGVMPRRSIQLDDVTFKFKSGTAEILRSISISIPVGSRVALVGRTGSGKTTLAHILLGLYQPTSGVLRLDGVAVSPEEMPAWQANCALVPQDIRLLDSSLRENVAFGVSPEHIDDVRVWSALESAQFDESVAEMPHGLYSVIGEDGVKLSGGQRQRLSLARAFYREAKVLVLDEATSALDNRTEHDVMQALDLIGRRCTTIVIAHRLSTVRKCDRIYEVDGGVIKAQGDFEYLCSASESFRDMNRLELS